MAINRAGDVEVPMTFLERWKRRAAARRERLRAALSSQSTARGQGGVRQDWIERNLANATARRRWLEARLEHVRALESLLRESTMRSQREGGGYSATDTGAPRGSQPSAGGAGGRGTAGKTGTATPGKET